MRFHWRLCSDGDIYWGTSFLSFSRLLSNWRLFRQSFILSVLYCSDPFLLPSLRDCFIHFSILKTRTRIFWVGSCSVLYSFISRYRSSVLFYQYILNVKLLYPYFPSELLSFNNRIAFYSNILYTCCLCQAKDQTRVYIFASNARFECLVVLWTIFAFLLLRSSASRQFM